MRTHLDQEEATFDFLVQFHVDDRRTPIEDATVEWQTQDAPYQRLGIIRIPRQRFDNPERATRGERMMFNPWHSLMAHTPLGGMNRARREIYRAMANLEASLDDSGWRQLPDSNSQRIQLFGSWILGVGN